MNVLIVTYPRIGLNVGGLQNQISETANALTELGVEVRRFSPWNDDVRDSDLLHCFSSDGSMLSHVRRARACGVPVVLSPIFGESNRSRAALRVKGMLARNVRAVYLDLRRSSQIVENADAIVCLNDVEADALRACFGRAVSERIVLIPNGIRMPPEGVDHRLFVDTTGLSDYVLMVSSIQRQKNILKALQALADCSRPIVVIGAEPTYSRGYFDECRAAAGNNVHFLGALSPDDPVLWSAFLGAHVFLHPSLAEVMPLAVYEAAAAGCNLVLSKMVPINSEIRELADIINPSEDGIRAGVDRALARPRREPKGRYSLSDVGLGSWHQVGEQLLGVYQSLTDSPSRRLGG